MFELQSHGYMPWSYNGTICFNAIIIFKNFVNLQKLADVQILEIEGLLCFPTVSQGIFCSKSEASSLILKYITVSFWSYTNFIWVESRISSYCYVLFGNIVALKTWKIICHIAQFQKFCIFCKIIIYYWIIQF